jgi:hypothetical protein
MALRIEVRMVPYVAPGPQRSTAWMKQNVMAPVDVIFDSACLQWYDHIVRQRDSNKNPFS